ncbi:MAG: choice-of-anchor D domain-containing protein [Verrucomicrobiia bacterium]|jgi:hypothetical protein
MKFSVSRWCVLVVLAGLIFMGVHSHATPTLPPSNNKVIIYPTGDETFDQLRQRGFTRVRNYGSYWLVEATDAQVDELTHLYGARAAVNNRFNRIELGSASFDTSVGEPPVPPQYRQAEGKGERLRLVQFRGPITPEWLRLITSKGAQVVSYVPNNAYLVLVDEVAESELRSGQGADSPIQWIGSYHPYYKIGRGLLNAIKENGQSLVDVQIAMAGGSAAEQTMAALKKFGLIQSGYHAADRKVARMTVPFSDIPRIARLEGVLWIESVERKILLDEVQDLLLAEQTSSQPGFGPTNSTGGARFFTNYLGGVTALFTNYIDFLTNTVGGGLPSFLEPTNYPIVDVADTGLDVGDPVVQPSLRGRVAYMEPGQNGYFDGSTVDSGCSPLSLNFIGTEDFYDHGTRVASVIVGFDQRTNVLDQLSIYSTIVTQTFGYNGLCLSAGGGSITITFPTSPCELTTNETYNCSGPGIPFFTVDLLTEVIVTQVVSFVYQDPSGFQLGLGVSPFGLIGSSRIWHQAADTTGTPPHARLLPNPQPTLPCMEGFYPTLFFHAYTFGARIQNDSWGEEMSSTGDNGGRYDLDAQIYDTGVRDALLVGDSNNVPTPFPLNQEFIIVFAGLSIRSDVGVIPGTGGIGDIRITSPGTAKNVITVCSSQSVRLDGSACDDQATDSLEMYDLSEFGPTLEGRIKPEIVAPATSVWAAKSLLAVAIDPVLGIIPVINEDPNGVLGGGAVFSCSETNLYCSPPKLFDACFTNTSASFPDSFPSPIGGEYDCDSGSSYAAPEVSGAIQLLWWYFQHRLTNELGSALLQPSPAMAKAYLCNAARYMPIQSPQYPGTLDTLPSIAQGMGELDLATMFDGVPRAIRDESSPRAIDTPLIATNPAPQQTYFSQSGQSYEVTGRIASNGLPFRVTLVWLDPPGNPAASASNQLVNDLNLQVTLGAGSNAAIYNGNQFFENVSTANSRIDTINNLQSVFLNPSTLLNGIPGVTSGAPFQVIVRAANIAGQGVPNVGEPTPGGSNTLNQDFALVIYNAATNTLSDVPNLATNNACQTAMPVTQFPFAFTNNLTKAVYRNVQPSPTAGRGGADEFFKIALPTPGAVFTISTLGSSFSGGPPLLSVWEVKVLPEALNVRGDCGALTEVVSTNSVPAQVNFTADGSNDYYIVVEPQNDGDGGTMVLNVNVPPGTVPITISPTSLTFGSQVAGTVSTQQVVTYMNGTTVGASIQSVSITGSNAADFTVVNDGCTGGRVGPGADCFVTVAFSPVTNDVGTLVANLVFTDNQTGSPRSIPLTGYATAPAPLVCLSTGTSITFSNQVIGTTGSVQSVTLTNCGSIPLTVSGVTISGAGSANFSVATLCTNSPISVEGTCTMNVAFAPTVAGAFHANLVIADDAAGSPTTVTLQGVGVAPAPAICLSSSSIDFGSVAVNVTGSVQSVTITNCGTAPLVISNIATTAGNTGDFLVVSTPCTTISSGATCVVSLKFAPTAGGLRSATLSIISSNNILPPQLVSLSGMGALSQPDAAISKSFSNLKKFVGFGVINTTGVGQEIVQNINLQTPTAIQKAIEKGRHGVRYYVAVENDGSGPDQFTVQSTQVSGGSGWTVNYYIGANPSESMDITTAVQAGTYETAAMETGAVTGDSTMIRAEVFADKTLVKKGTQATFTLTFTSVSDTAQQDTVRITALAK